MLLWSNRTFHIYSRIPKDEQIKLILGKMIKLSSKSLICLKKSLLTGMNRRIDCVDCERGLPATCLRWPIRSGYWLTWHGLCGCVVGLADSYVSPIGLLDLGLEMDGRGGGVHRGSLRLTKGAVVRGAGSIAGERVWRGEGSQGGVDGELGLSTATTGCLMERGAGMLLYLVVGHVGGAWEE